MPIPPHVADFWLAYAQAQGGVDETRFYEAFSFGDCEELAESLAKLVLSGVKRATAGSVWSFEAEGKRLPAPGDLSIVTSWAGTPLCVIETLAVDVVPFNEVTAEFAATSRVRPRRASVRGGHAGRLRAFPCGVSGVRSAVARFGLLGTNTIDAMQVLPPAPVTEHLRRCEGSV